MRPVRIVLSRRAGFDLQAISHSINGLPAHSVARPGPWGNPFSIDAVAKETGLDRAAAQAEARASISPRSRALDARRDRGGSATAIA